MDKIYVPRKVNGRWTTVEVLVEHKRKRPTIVGLSIPRKHVKAIADRLERKHGLRIVTER